MLKPRVEVKGVDGVLVAEFWDCLRLDPVPVSQLRQELEAHLRRGGRAHLVVDLNGVTFAGSAALGGFVAIQRTCRTQSGRFLFCNVDRTVREVFRISNLEALFQFAEDVPAALAALGNEGPAPEPPTAAVAPSPPRPPLSRRRPPS